MRDIVRIYRTIAIVFDSFWLYIYFFFYVLLRSNYDNSQTHSLLLFTHSHIGNDSSVQQCEHIRLKTNRQSHNGIQFQFSYIKYIHFGIQSMYACHRPEGTASVIDKQTNTLTELNVKPKIYPHALLHSLCSSYRRQYAPASLNAAQFLFLSDQPDRFQYSTYNIHEKQHNFVMVLFVHEYTYIHIGIGTLAHCMIIIIIIIMFMVMMSNI